VYGESEATNGNGVLGVANQGSGAWGVAGMSSSGDGVYGYSTGSGASGVFAQGYYGVVAYGSPAYGVSGSGSIGVYGSGSGTGVEGSGPDYGVFSDGTLGSETYTGSDVALADNRVVELYAMQSPENWFEDFGSGQLHDGVATVVLDPTFALAVNPQRVTTSSSPLTVTAKGCTWPRRRPRAFRCASCGAGSRTLPLTTGLWPSGAVMRTCAWPSLRPTPRRCSASVR
jgi:hypothetical protein